MLLPAIIKTMRISRGVRQIKEKMFFTLLRQYGEKAFSAVRFASGQSASREPSGIYPSRIKVTALRGQFGINAAGNRRKVAQIADIIFAAVKPGIVIKVLGEITST